MIELQGDRVAVVPLFDPDMTESGLLYIPEQAKERVDQGIVKYIGPKCETVKIGDHIIFSGFTGTTVYIEGEGYMIILPEEFIAATLETPATDINGLYFRGANGEYFTATYEQAMHLIGLAVQGSPWFRKVNVHSTINTRPKVEEYERLK